MNTQPVNGEYQQAFEQAMALLKLAQERELSCEESQQLEVRILVCRYYEQE